MSVIIPAYNAAAYIGGALESVFAQTFEDYEVIVVNDGSPDTPALERALAPYAGRIAYVEQENRGPSGARNAAIEAARGHYVALLDSDDEWLPEYLAEQVGMFEADPRLDMVYADAELFGDSSLAGKTFMESAPSRGPVTFESLLRYESSIITSGTVARKQALVEAGLFDEAFVRCEDFDLWLRLAHRGGRISYQRRVLARHRAHAGSLAADPILMVEAQIRVLEKSLHLQPLTAAQRELIERQRLNCSAQIDLERGRRHFAGGEYEQASAALRRANDFYRSRRLRLVLWALRAAPGVLSSVARARQKLSGRGAASGAR
ncbi:MAG TPA: glycosyltransferase family A protein [Pyrinomonadaceae bacterium]